MKIQATLSLILALVSISARADSIVMDEETGFSATQVEAPVSVDPANELMVSEVAQNDDLRNQKCTLVKDSQLTLFGRGIYNKKNNESLVIACVGDVVAQGSLERKCDQLQFVLFDVKRTATWYSVPFAFGTQKSFTKKMKNLEKFARGGSWLATNPREIIGCLITFGGAGALTVAVGTGVGVVAFGLATLIASQSGKGWKAFDFLSPLPALFVDAAQERPFLATANKDGWSWSSNPIKMRAAKFERLKYLLAEHDEVVDRN